MKEESKKPNHAEMAQEAAEAVAKHEERSYNFTRKKEDSEEREVYTLKESELDEIHHGHLLQHLFKTYNESPVIVRDTFFADIVGKMAEFAKKNKGLMKKSKGYKTGK